MHKDFAEWYRGAGIPPNGDILPKRWQAIEKYEAGRDEIVSLVRLFYRLGKPSEEFENAFRTAFQTTDPAFQMRDNDQELLVLAGAELIDIIERGPVELADLAALSLVCAAAQNLRGAAAVPDIPEFAARYLSKRAIERAHEGQGDNDSASSSRKALLDGLTSAPPPINGLPAELERLQRELAVVSEESNMLWWLFSEYSHDLKQPWAKSTVPAAALVAGKELAELTRVLPGPIAAAAFLDRIIRFAKAKPPSTILVVEAINDVTIEWRRTYAERNCLAELEDLVPISHGVKISLTAPEDDAWFIAFKTGTGISSDSKLAPHFLAYQMFLEGLLCRSWRMVR
jgi:hypothetical protein